MKISWLETHVDVIVVPRILCPDVPGRLLYNAGRRSEQHDDGNVRGAVCNGRVLAATHPTVAAGLDHAAHRAGSCDGGHGSDGWGHPGDGPHERLAERVAERAAAVRHHPSPVILQQV